MVTPSGSDCDAVTTLILARYSKNLHFINIFPEEAGRLSIRFQILDLDKSDLYSSYESFKDSYDSLGLIKRKTKITSSSISLLNSDSKLIYKSKLKELLEQLSRDQAMR